MQDYETDDRFLKRWKDNFFYFVWGPSNPPNLWQDMQISEKPKGLYVMGIEEWEGAELFPNVWEYFALKEYAKNYNIDLKVFIGAIKDQTYNSRWHYNNEDNIVSVPTYFANIIIDHAIQNNRKPLAHTKIEKLYTSMNGRAHPWRCMFIDEMYGAGLFDYGNVSWHNLDNFELDYEFKHWQPTSLSFDKNFEGSDGMCDIFRPPEEFQTSLFSFISESNTKCLFYTEKTFLPILNKRPFFIFGAPYANTYLKNLGFEIFDEVIDYSFDSVDNDLHRCQLYFEQAQKLSQMSLDTLHNTVYSKVEHNFNRLLEIVENKEYVPKAFDKICKQNKDNMYVTNYHRLLNIGSTEQYKDWKSKI